MCFGPLFPRGKYLLCFGGMVIEFLNSIFWHGWFTAVLCCTKIQAADSHKLHEKKAAMC
jgi:hypothetical protein